MGRTTHETDGNDYRGIIATYQNRTIDCEGRVTASIYKREAMFERGENSNAYYTAAPAACVSTSATARTTASAPSAPSRVEIVKQSIEDVRHKMSGVIEKALETTEKIEDLEDETKKLAAQ